MASSPNDFGAQSLADNEVAAGKARPNWVVVDAVVLVALAIYVLYYSTAFRFDTLFAVEPRQVDFRMWYLFPQLIFQNMHYPAVVSGDWATNFPYLPSAVAMMLSLSVFPQAVSFGVWIVLQAAAFAIVLWAGLGLSGARGRPDQLLIAAVAVFLADSALGWDFRNHNNNLIYLALVMLGLTARPAWLSGLLFAVSLNLKLYSGLLFAGFVWRREYRLAAVMVAGSIVVGVVFPVLVFGPGGYLQLMHDWAVQVQYTFSPSIQATAPTTLLRSVATFLGAAPASTQVTVTLRTLQAGWIALIIAYFGIAARAEPVSAIARNQARLADIVVLLMAPLPLSTWFLPYHAVVMLPAWLLVVTVAANKEWPRWIRLAAIAVMVASQILRFGIHDWNYRGAMYFMSFVLLTAVLSSVRYTLAHERGAA